MGKPLIEKQKPYSVGKLTRVYCQKDHPILSSIGTRAFGTGPFSSNSTININEDYTFDLAFFVRNATDDIHAVALNSYYAFVGTAYAVYSEPRMWGAQVRYRFGAQ